MPKVRKLGTPRINYMAAMFKAYRNDRGMTSVDVAERVGCTPQNARVQMSKQADKWNIGDLKRYCDALSIPYEVAFREASR